MESSRYFIGLDLGQAAEYTALAIVEQISSGDMASYHVRHLQRWPLGSSYPHILRDLEAHVREPPLQGATLAIDQTAVGRTIVDFFRALDRWTELRPVIITAGGVVHWHKRCFHVPKIELAGTMQSLLQTQRVKFAKLPETPVLVKELQAFRIKVVATKPDDLECWRERDHDDLCFAVMMAVWLGERMGPVYIEPYCLTWPQAPIDDERWWST